MTAVIEPDPNQVPAEFRGTRWLYLYRMRLDPTTPAEWIIHAPGCPDGPECCEPETCTMDHTTPVDRIVESIVSGDADNPITGHAACGTEPLATFIRQARSTAHA